MQSVDMGTALCSANWHRMRGRRVSWQWITKPSNESWEEVVGFLLLDAWTFFFLFLSKPVIRQKNKFNLTMNWMPQAKCLGQKQPVWSFALCQAEEAAASGVWWQELLRIPCGSEEASPPPPPECTACSRDLPALPSASALQSHLPSPHLHFSFRSFL